MSAKLDTIKGRGVFFGTAALFASALLLGGYGPHAPFLNGLLEVAAFPLLVAILLYHRVGSFARPDRAVPIAFLLLLLVTGVAQLIPLPPATWRALPGREIPAMIFDTLGEPARWRPLSLSPEDTRLVVQSWLPPFAIFLATLLATSDERRRLALIAVVVAAASSLVGLLQLANVGSMFSVDPLNTVDRFPGLFANINHQAVFLACTVALLPPLADTATTRGTLRWWPAAFWLLALLGTLATASRTGVVLFAVSSLASGLRVVRRTGGRPHVRHRQVTVLATTLAGFMALGLILVGGYRTEFVSSRFEQVGQDVRFGFWAVTEKAIRSHLPVGAGLGTFEAVYQVAEPLESVQPYLVNHAHSDYLEFALETGVVGILLIVLFIVWFAERIVRYLREGHAADPLVWSGVMIVALVLVHSLVDYPLRTESVGCLFAFGAAMLIVPPRGSADLRSARRPGASRR